MIEFILKLLKEVTFKKFSNLVDQVYQYIHFTLGNVLFKT